MNSSTKIILTTVYQTLIMLKFSKKEEYVVLSNDIACLWEVPYGIKPMSNFPSNDVNSARYSGIC